MAYKPSDLFVGVIDLFAVLLPGAITVAIWYPRLPDFVIGPAGIIQPIQGTANGWIAFFLAAYLTGHLLFLVGGAVLDSVVYDALRTLFVPPSKDQTYFAATAYKDRALGNTKAGINTFQWARAVLRLTAPAALAEVERYEADSKFFRSLCVALYILMVVFLGSGKPTSQCIPQVDLSCANLGVLLVALAIPVSFLLLKVLFDHPPSASASPAVAGTKAPTDPPRFQWYIPAALAVLLAAILSRAGDMRPLVLFVLSVLCLWRYSDRRWKTTRTACQYVVILEKTPARLTAGASVEA